MTCDRKYQINPRKLLQTSSKAFCFAILLFAPLALSQEVSGFDLFESVQANGSERTTSSNDGRFRQSQASPTSSEPVFTLIGTSRIGDKTSITLRHVSGEKVSVRYTGQPTNIIGYEGFHVAEVNGRQVSIRHPSSAPCIDFEDLGIDCDHESNTSRIRLTSATAIPSSSAGTLETEGLSLDPPEEARVNPFDVLRRTSGGAASDGPIENPRRFQPRRIDPAEVPPGMRIVSTPFGDRLVEI